MIKNDGGKKRLEENLYLPSGYLNMKYIIYELDFPFIIITGGRGTGKTYGTLEVVHNDPGLGTLYMRSDDAEHKLISKPKFSPFGWHNQDFGWNVQPYNIGDGFAEWKESELDEETGKMVPVGEPIMTSCSLYKIANIRGFNGSDINLIVYDEFNPQKGKRSLVTETMFPDAYETICRNRELQGKKPTKALMLSNANRLDNPIFRGYNLMDVAEKLANKVKETNEVQIYMSKQRGICLMMFPETEISKKKKGTALYRATGDSDYGKMALDNEFSFDKPTRIRSESLKGYERVFRTWSFGVWWRKGQNEYFVSKLLDGKWNDIYEETHADIVRGRKRYANIWSSYIKGNIIFESYSLEVDFKKFFLDSVRGK